MGCGRLFEGTPEQMHHSLGRLADLPDDMKLYCAHEYTLDDARFAAHAFPENEEFPIGSYRIKQDGGRTTDGSDDGRRGAATNTFLLAGDLEQFTDLRRREG